MTDAKSMQILMCIQPGEPVRADTVMKRTGFSRSDVGPTLHRLRREGKLVLLCRAVYALAGSTTALERFAQEVRDAEKDKRTARRKAAQARYADKLKERRRAEAVYGVRPANYGDGIVAEAKASRSFLAMAWGGANVA